MAFMLRMLMLLGVDPDKAWPQYSELKARFTPDVVHDIHLTILELWPNAIDYEKCLSSESDEPTALYTGDYDPDSVVRAVTRHALYSEKIYLIDPFIYSGTVRAEFDPIIRPQEHQSNTIQSAYLWFRLAPWIQKGIVCFIRPPSDFMPGLKLKTIEVEHARYDKYPDLAAELERQVEERMSQQALDRGMKEYFLLSLSDEQLLEDWESFSNGRSKEDFLRFIKQRRLEHPYWIMPSKGGTSILIQSSGANYELSKIAAAITKSHLITSFGNRWKEMEIDRQEGGAITSVEAWQPFAKALQTSKLKVLDEVSLEGVFHLRTENRLERMRLFFNKVWRSCHESNEFAEANALNLASELADQIADAEAEWKKIDIDLVKWGAAPGAIAAASVIGFLPESGAAVGAAAAGVFALVQSQLQRSSFKNQYPAGFFLGPHKKS